MRRAVLFVLEADNALYRHALRPDIKREVEENGRITLQPDEKERNVLVNDLWMVMFFANYFGSVYISKVAAMWLVGTGRTPWQFGFAFGFIMMAVSGASEGFIIFRHKGAPFRVAMMALQAILSVTGGFMSIVSPNIIGST